MKEAVDLLSEAGRALRYTDILDHVGSDWMTGPPPVGPQMLGLLRSRPETFQRVGEGKYALTAGAYENAIRERGQDGAPRPPAGLPD